MNMMTALQRPYVAPPLFQPRRSPERFKRMVALFERDEIADAVDALLAYMDAASGDPDLELTGDEDDFVRHAAHGPGCVLADPDIGVDDNGGVTGSGDRTYAEWDTLSANTRRAGRIDGKPIDNFYASLCEDAEDDDAAEGNGDESDGTSAEDDFAYFSQVGGWSPTRGTPGGFGAGCPLADPGGCQHDGREPDEGL